MNIAPFVFGVLLDFFSIDWFRGKIQEISLDFMGKSMVSGSD